mmetsp:Transcript_27001/g.77885  ORF Transcript_27001/g.77885 Transcript_27001/m.77885 type:complete len:209 (-) Transcript_27001:647-1273(-)
MGPPTCPTVDMSSGWQMVAPAAPSVWPYPSTTGTPSMHRKKIMTPSESGADPLTMKRRWSSPRAFLILLKINRSYSPCVSLPCWSPSALAARAASNSFFFIPPAALMPVWILSYILFRTRGAAGSIVGRHACRSSTKSLGSPRKKPTEAPASRTWAWTTRSKMCGRGRYDRCRSKGWVSTRFCMAPTALMRFSWVRRAPLGLPVVPEV